jgi:LAGLIDADG endonuclease
MFTVGLDVDSVESGIVVKLSQITGLFAGKPLNSWSYYQATCAMMPLRRLAKQPIGSLRKIQEQKQTDSSLSALVDREQTATQSEAEGQSAGKRKFSPISDYAPKHRKPSSPGEFAYPLAGLIEGTLVLFFKKKQGDGCFTEKRLEIVFHEDDVANAYFVKEMVGFGTVGKVKYKRAVRYILRHMTGLRKVVTLVNGKLKTENKIAQWKKHNYEQVFGINILPVDQSSLLSNHWLAGFTDADGCFHISIVNSSTYTTGKRIRLEYKITQKDPTALKKIQQVFGGGLSFCKKKIMYRYCSINLNATYQVISYFDTFHCNSSPKLVDFLKWRKVYRIIQRKEHLTSKGLEEVFLIKKDKLMEHHE